MTGIQSAEDLIAHAKLNAPDETPRVSVIVLSHRPDCYPRALASVAAQTYENVETILLHHKRYELDKFNRAALGASGKYLVFLPDDDELLPTFVARHVEEAERVNADVVYSDLYVTGPLLLKFQLPAFDREILRLHCVPYFTFMVRADFWRTLPNGYQGHPGGWDGSLSHCDWDAGIRMYAAGAKVVHLEREFLWNRAHHAQSASLLMTKDQADAALVALRRKHAVSVLG